MHAPQVPHVTCTRAPAVGYPPQCLWTPVMTHWRCAKCDRSATEVRLRCGVRSFAIRTSRRRVGNTPSWSSVPARKPTRNQGTGSLKQYPMPHLHPCDVAASHIIIEPYPPPRRPVEVRTAIQYPVEKVITISQYHQALHQFGLCARN